MSNFGKSKKSASLRSSFVAEAISSAVLETAALQKDAPRSDEERGETW